jgi:hypothetical protein
MTLRVMEGIPKLSLGTRNMNIPFLMVYGKFLWQERAGFQWKNNFRLKMVFLPF